MASSVCAACEHNLCNTHFKKAFANRVKRILADTPEVYWSSEFRCATC